MTYQTILGVTSAVATGNPTCHGKRRIVDMQFQDVVTGLNQLGLQALHDGNAMEAKRSFARALSQATINTAWPLETPNEFSNDWGCSHSEITTTSSASIDKALYIYQREQYDEGLFLYREALHIPEDRARPILDATLMYNVGQAYIRSQHYKEARRWFTFALALVVASELQGWKNGIINSFMIQHNLGYCSYCLGDNDQAVAHYQEALTLAGSLGLGKLDLAAACNAVAVMLFHQASPDKALELLNISLVIYRSIVGDSSPQVATCLSNQGRVYYLMCDYKKALSSFHEAMSIRERVLGAGSVDFLTAIFNMGQTYQKLGSLNEAKKCYTQFLTVAKVKLGRDHRDVSAALKSLADTHREERSFPTALVLMKESLESGKAALGHDHAELTRILNDMGSLCYEMSSYDEALNYFQECLVVQRKVLGSKCHPHILITMLNIAQIQKQSCDHNAAFETYREIYSLQIDSTEKLENLEVASTVSSMGLMKYLLHDYSAALNFYLEALRLRRLAFGKDVNHVDIASTLNSIGLVYFKLNLCSQANEAFMKCMSIRQALLGPHHRDVAILYYNIATVLIESGDDQTAIKFYKESLRVERVVLGESHPEIAQTLKHLGQVYQEQGQLTEAQETFNEALNILRAVEGAKDVEAISQLLNLIGDIHLMHGEIDEMMTCFAEVCRLTGQDGISLTIAGRSYYEINRQHPPSAPVA